MCLCKLTYMTTKTITITLDAYNRLNQLKKDKNESFSDLITRITPEKRKLSEILANYEPNTDLAISIKDVSKEMRSSRMREVKL
jgi:predicted CopG family antitoxin